MIVNTKGLFAISRTDVAQLDRFSRYALAAIHKQDANIASQDPQVFYRIAHTIEAALKGPIPMVKLRADNGEAATFMRVLRAGLRLSQPDNPEYEADRLVMQDLCQRIQDRCIFTGTVILNPAETSKPVEITMSKRGLTLKKRSETSCRYVAKPNPVAYWLARWFGEVIRYPSGLPMYYRAFRKLYPSRFARI